MRPACLPALVLLLLTACGQEPDFDERYDAAEQKIRDKAARMEAELQARQAGAGEQAGTSGEE